ncbi:PIG-L family deacetylase [Lichenihabitans sp. Uapishka_5]|uniref:PIG-L deacetylase family protein n=1 Tax=Lichenihabitans sp. Uapishka_5 TaxID=3037302 RepID=UPI0029E81336|nr:PIG-L family deacetylase [Lichenihabitans sp. Uapishka_5]MDX7949731.1 PIG-L family deacetylase [Lichenihabitans sp. Uapishka_5]
MSRTALALSPHLDDAVFSCGGTLNRLARAGWRVVVATLFTRSVLNPTGFALACQLDKGLTPEVDYMALRRAEDDAALQRLGCEPDHGDLVEAPHRGYDSARALFAGPLPADTIVEALGRTVSDLRARVRPDLLLAPQAIGGHVDHIQLVRALGEPEGPVLWWRDFPYLVRSATPPEPFGAVMAAKPEWAVTLDALAIAQKEAACLAYASQLGYQFGGPDGLRERLAATGGIEHFRQDGQVDVALEPTIRSASVR